MTGPAAVAAGGADPEAGAAAAVAGGSPVRRRPGSMDGAWGDNGLREPLVRGRPATSPRRVAQGPGVGRSPGVGSPAGGAPAVSRTATSAGSASASAAAEGAPVVAHEVALARNRSLVRGLEYAAVLCWLATLSAGVYGCWLGYNTRAADHGTDASVCQLVTRDETALLGEARCKLTSDHGAVCAACHRAKTDAMLILISFYMTLFGLLGAVSSSGVCDVSGSFGFLRSRIGRGVLLVFVGSLAIAQGTNFLYTENFTLVVGCIDTFFGLLVLLSYCLVPSGVQYVPVSPSGPADAATPGTQQHPRSRAGSTASAAH
jgi:hypothetical protein